MSRPRAETEALVRIAEERWGPRRNWRCVYCGRLGRQVDHFWPESQGGTNEPRNLVPACENCNNRKNARHPVEWMKAVGVPFERAKVLWAIYHDPDLPVPTAAELPRVVLSYTEPEASRGLAPCGTDSAYRRHRRRHEHCQVCRDAHNEANKAWAARKRAG